jgi:hypothetical protein
MNAPNPGRLLTAAVCLGVLLTVAGGAQACTSCNPTLQAAIFRESFGMLLLYMLLPFAFVGMLCFRLNKLK